MSAFHGSSPSPSLNDNAFPVVLTPQMLSRRIPLIELDPAILSLVESSYPHMIGIGSGSGSDSGIGTRIGIGIGANVVPESITVSELQQVVHSKYDVFLTHDWGEDRENHYRVAAINEELKRRGLITWFDDERMEGNIHGKMTSGIDSSACVVVFITQRYIRKVGGTNEGDNCKLEFGYASNRKTAVKMLPVVM